MDERELIDKWVKMWNTYDLKDVDEFFVKSDDLTYFSSEKAGIIRGIEAVREHHRGFGFVEGGKQSANKLWLDDLLVKKYGDFTVAIAIWFFQKPTGKVQRGPVTFAIANHGGKCRFTHLHFANDKPAE